MKNLLQEPQCKHSVFIMFNRCHLIVCLLLLLSSHSLLSYAKSMEHHSHHQQQHERILRKRNAAESPSCELVQHFFESLNVSTNHPQANDKPNGKWRSFVSSMNELSVVNILWFSVYLFFFSFFLFYSPTSMCTLNPPVRPILLSDWHWNTQCIIHLNTIMK